MNYTALSSKQAQDKLIEFGENKLAEEPPPSKFKLFINQFKSPLVYILFIAAAVTLYLNELVDTSVIMAAVLINTILGYVQEQKAQNALLALKKIITPKAKVIRDGKKISLPTKLIVPGDIIIISNGDKIPADGTMLEANNLFINEAILTGESQLQEKSTAKNISQVFMGTIVASGRGKMVVTATGKATQIGKIAQTLKETHEEQTPLQIQLSYLAKLLAYIVFGISFTIFVTGLLSGNNVLDMFETSVAVAVSAIPEGMVISLTVILAVGMQQILKRKALVRRLVSAETLGSVTTICVDKTGTITEGTMRVVKHKVMDEDEAVKASVLANDLEDPIEIALWEWARSEKKTDPEKLSDQFPRKNEIPFDGTNKFMAVETDKNIFVKGAPEIIFEKSKLTNKEKSSWQEILNRYSQEGLRVIALAKKKKSADKKLVNDIDNLSFIGLLAVSDPLRPGIKNAFDICQKAGVKIKVITGDYRITSEAILKKIGIPITNPQTQIIEGREIEKISDDELANKVGDVILFSRVTPHQKLRIVESLQKNGEVVAMTGDGVNDSLALKKAEIAIVVEKAPDVARETADIVLLDSNLGTIVAAIEEGRAIFQNIRKVVLYLLSDSFSEMIMIISAIFMKLPLPLTASQILWINIISDGFPNLALAFEPKDKGLMSKKPRPKSAPIVDLEIKVLIGIISITNSVLAMIVFILSLKNTGDIIYARTMSFAIIGSDSLFYVFSCRSLNKPIWKDDFFKNPRLILAVAVGFVLQLLPIYHPTLNRMFQTQPLTLPDWFIIISVVAVLIFVIETIKHLFFHYRKTHY